MTDQLISGNARSYFVFNQEKRAERVEIQFEGDAKRSTAISQGTIDFVLVGADVAAFLDRPVDYIKRAILATGKKVNALRVEDRSEEGVASRSAARAWGACLCKCTWVHIDEPPEHESTWICIKLPPQMLMPIA